MHREYVAVAGHGAWLAVLFNFLSCGTLMGSRVHRQKKKKKKKKKKNTRKGVNVYRLYFLFSFMRFPAF